MLLMSSFLKRDDDALYKTTPLEDNKAENDCSQNVTALSSTVFQWSNSVLSVLKKAESCHFQALSRME